MKQRLVVFLISVSLCGAYYSLRSNTPHKPSLMGLAVNEANQVFAFDGEDYDEQAQLLKTEKTSDYLLRNAHLPTTLTYQSATSHVDIALRHRGLYRLSDWGKRVQPLPKLMKRPMRYDTLSQREVSGLSLDGSIVLHKHNILYFDKKLNRYIELKHDISSGKMLTAVFRAGNTLYIGTSVNGLYVSRNFSDEAAAKGKKVRFHNKYKGLPYISHDKRVALFEEIRTIYVTVKGSVYVGTVNSGGAYFKGPQMKRFSRLNWPIAKGTMIDVFQISANEKTVWVSTSKGLIVLEKQSNKATLHKWPSLAGELEGRVLTLLVSKNDKRLFAWYKSKTYVLNEKRAGYRQKARGRRLFYSSALNYRTKKKRNIERMLKRGIYNGVVVDVKDDFGAIRYHSKVPFVKKIKALRPTFSLRELVKYAHSLNTYVVARVVVMKDRSLYRTRGYAILDRRTKKPWVGNPDEHWIDPYNPDLATNYYIPLIKELQEIGVDEVQLDYIRFPSDGAIWRHHYRYKKGDMYKSEALENFLYQVSQATQIPLSVDVYGYHGIYRAAGSIGQDMDAFGSYVDVVSPMVYSSHFGPRYLTQGPRSERAYNLLNHCAKRSLHIAADRYLVRPYLQAFPMRNHIWGYGTKYFQDQIRGGLDEGIQGYIFWGAISHMKRVEKAISAMKQSEKK